MTTIESSARVAVDRDVAEELTRACTLGTAGHEWTLSNVDSARAVLGIGCDTTVVDALTRRVARCSASGPGWVVVALPAVLGDEDLQVAGAGVLAAVGRPFNSIDQNGRLWIGRESSARCDPASFGGFGRNGLHIDAPNVEHIPDYTGLLVLRADPAGGGASLLGDLHAAMDLLDEADRAALREPVFFEGRADGLRGVGAPRLPFPILDGSGAGRPWIRWAAKLLADDRNTRHRAVLARFADALESTATTIRLNRGELLLVDQQRVAHGRTALGDQHGLGDGSRRWLVQTKAAADPTAPAQRGGCRR